MECFNIGMTQAVYRQSECFYDVVGDHTVPYFNHAITCADHQPGAEDPHTPHGC